MKKVVYGLASLVLVVMLFPSFANAQEAQDPGTTDSNSPTTTSTNETESENTEELNQRVKVYKEKLSKRLTTAETKKITGVCKAAQVITSKAGTKAGLVKENRTKVYAKVSEKLSGVVGKLQKAGADTTELEASLDVLQQQIDQLIADAEEYQTALSDSAEMDCETNPDAFKSALEQARAKRLELFNSSKEIRTYIQETIKPQLQTLKSQLNQPTDTTDEGVDQ